MDFLPGFWGYILFSAIVMTVAVIVARSIRFIMGRLIRGASTKLKVDPTKYNFLKNAVEFIVYIIALIVLFNSIPTLKSYGAALFAGAGVLAAIVGFASQSAFSNIISGIFIVIFRPFSVGDRVKVGLLYSGDVEDITLRHTVIKDFENRRIVIPNSVINNETIINSTLENEVLCMFIELGLSFDSNLDQALRIMQEEAMKHPDCLDNRTAEEIESGVPQVRVRLVNISETALQLRAGAWAKDPATGFAMKCDLLRSIKLRFDEAGLSLARPQQTVYIKHQTPDA
ncbi:mechanosensitive ion channel family protein [Parachryseolinea silvisoli]|jgi:small conductance mechanosensitive channel|uniref:mechanosensitive ion channel family protein n=1 Tax=Parachryseolinea silvisoli TaxID=2873601 RepID=UPI002265C169|nr:mechanosensitive ion channel family protein [Parachryseolinea silvisoli]MCD9018559.1 mechanosensitive ion channel family protein [Parachryseolinea silvisoli]